MLKIREDRLAIRREFEAEVEFLEEVSFSPFSGVFCYQISLRMMGERHEAYLCEAQSSGLRFFDLRALGGVDSHRRIFFDTIDAILMQRIVARDQEALRFCLRAIRHR